MGAQVNEAYDVEKGQLRRLPHLLPDTDRRLETLSAGDGDVGTITRQSGGRTWRREE